jgi:hypothetical protein
MAHVSDSDHCRLEAIVRSDCIIESHEISDTSRGWRRVPVTKVWRTERVLGRGGFGQVHLQYLDSDKKTTRALKIIPTRGLSMSIADCQRELVAMIEFKKPKVCKSLEPRIDIFTVDSVQGSRSLCRLLRMVSKRRCHILGHGIYVTR